MVGINKMNLLKSVFALFGIIPFLILSTKYVHASDFKTSYETEYYVRENDPQGFTKAAYTIRLTNTKPDLVIKTYTLSFPKSFSIGNIVARDNKGSIIPKITDRERYTDVALTFNDPTPGLNEVNSLYLDFQQKNIFREKGSVWEVFIPTMPTDTTTTQSISLYLPPGKNKRLSLSKPLPDNVSFDKITWNSIKGKSIYAVFGQSQRYSLHLTYELQNPNIYQVYSDVAFPPETLYQQIFINSISPKPDSVFSDSDGNMMGRYFLKPQETKKIIFEGQAEVFAKPREDFIAISRKLFQTQKQTLFNKQKYWELPNDTPVTSNRIEDHYKYVIDTLSYNYGRILTGNSRMGAAEALRFPDQAVCTEYSDLLVASARARRIPIREIQGYAFAQEDELRPIQTESDILHSWVEYYDENKEIWIPVDPTWEDTSGIDYFNSFDVNHIVFAIHGKQADYPYPAGSYKSKPGGIFVRVEPTAEAQIAKPILDVSFSELGIPSANQGIFSTKVTITNSGNIALWDKEVEISIEGGTLQNKQVKLERLFPGERSQQEVYFIPNGKGFMDSITLAASYEGSESPSFTITVPTFLPGIKNALLPIGIILVGVTILILLFRKKNDT